MLEPDGDGFRVLAQGQAGAVADEPLWRVTLDLAPGRWPAPGGVPLLVVALGNSYASTAHTSSSTGLHLFRWDGAALRPVFAALVKRYSYDKDGAETCVESQGYARPSGRGRPAPDAVATACDRQHTCEGAWSVDPASVSGSVPDLVMRDARNRAVSRHHWTGTAYAPPTWTS